MRVVFISPQSLIQSAQASTDTEDAKRMFENALDVISIMQARRFTQGTTTAFRAIIHAASVAQCPEIVDRALSLQSEAITAGVLSKYVGVIPKSHHPSAHQPLNKSGDLSQPQLWLDLEPNMAAIMDPTSPASINGIPMPPTSPFVKPQYEMPQDTTKTPHRGHKYQPPAEFTFIIKCTTDLTSEGADEEDNEVKSSDDNDYSEELNNVMPWRVSSDDDYSSDESPSA